jgi:nicotinate-nucleotide--dimethylbenzimidazole phosphoribosyltransferase
MERIRGIIEKIQDLDPCAMDACQKRLDSLTKPRGSLGRLEELARQIAGIRGQALPMVRNKVIFTLAADHGVTQEGVSAYPSEVTAQMVYNFLKGGAAINCLARLAGAKVIVADVGVAGVLDSDELTVKKTAKGTANMTKTAAMSREQAVVSITNGAELFEQEFGKGIDIAGTGEMGIGNTTSAAALTAVFTGKPPEAVTGRGTGLSKEGLARKIEVIQRVLKMHRPDPADPIGVLSKVGGFEIGGMAGIMLASAGRRVPVVIDGFISGAAALIACSLAPAVKNYLIASHRSVEQGHSVILEHLGLRPLFDLDLRLGEGTGAALGIILAEASTRILREMATFGEAGVSERAKT